MKEFGKLFEGMYNAEKQRTQQGRAFKFLDESSYSMHEASHALPSGPQDEFFLQKIIRPFFGKKGVNATEIGTHPDFVDLEEEEDYIKYHYICTIFVDIVGSTRLSLLYSLEDVYLFKNAVIKTCIEIIRSFDGYVHRLMGDAVMAFFGGNYTSKENAIADVLNCSITLRAILEENIKPWMINNGMDEKDFGFRVGCDFGDDDEILWASFGYKRVGEVSAAGFPVDMAAKLQDLANKNQTMLGQTLLDFVNWPEEYSNIKQKKKGETKESMPVVLPNLTDSNGRPVNYRMRLLDYYSCLKFSALPRKFRENIASTSVNHNPGIHYTCYVKTNDSWYTYISASEFLDKNNELVFEVKANTRTRISFPLKVVFTKTNHGPETPIQERDVGYEPVIKYMHKTSKYNRSPPNFCKVTLNENTLYRSLHTMRCEIYDSNGVNIFRDWIGVMIK
jgi:class 3 adenylate cyclase